MSAESEFQRAAQAYRTGDFSTVVRVCEELIRQTPGPDALAAIFNLKALGLSGQGLMFAAADCIEEAILLNPENALLRHHAARIFLALGRHEAARQEAEKACAIAPGSTAYRYQLARVHLLAGDSVKSEELAQQCVKQDPAVFEAWMLLSELAANRGDRARAGACLREILGRDPGHVRAWSALAAMPGETDQDGSIERALADIETCTKDDDSIASASFALADMARRRGDFQAAFRRYKNANERLEKVQTFSIDQWEAAVRATVASSSAWLESTGVPTPAAAGSDGAGLIFIVGMPRSGTTLVEQVLCSHPGVLGAGELTTMEYITKSLEYQGVDPFGVESAPGWLNRMRRAYLDSLPAVAADHHRVIDKTPRNFERLGLIFRLFPAARVIWCLRHPLDTIISCYFQDFVKGQQFSNSLVHCARMYIAHVHLMRHWMHYFGDSIQVIEYAALVQNLEAVAPELASFIGVDFHPAMLQPHRNARPVRTASSEQVRRPVYTTSLNNWHHYRDELAEVCALLQKQGMLDGENRSIVLP